MNIIFLDIDGVLNCSKTKEFKTEKYAIDKILLKRLKNIIEKTGVSIVLSSVWRFDENSCVYLKSIGINFIDKTPNFKNKIRGYEIEAWLKEHPEVKKYAILDDDSDMLFSQKPYFFKTSFKIGLTKEIEKDIIKYFNEDLRLCLYCGNLLKRVPDPVTHNKSIYLWHCSCIPKNTFISIK